MKVAPAHSHKFRYCHYLGKYNCSGCHKDQMSAIPAKIIERWDFTFHPVSSFAYHLLNDIATCPLYSLDHLNPELYVKVRVLQAARNIRVNLKYIRDFIVNCRFAEGWDMIFGVFLNHTYEMILISGWNNSSATSRIISRTTWTVGPWLTLLRFVTGRSRRRKPSS